MVIKNFQAALNKALYNVLQAAKEAVATKLLSSPLSTWQRKRPVHKKSKGVVINVEPVNQSAMAE